MEQQRQRQHQVRYYLPLAPAELLNAAPPQRTCIEVVEDADEASVLELKAEQALEEAAFASLSLSLETPLPGRLVAVADTPPVAWEDVQSFHIESPEGMVEAAALAQVAATESVTQDDLDGAVEALWEHPLQWYDVTELQALRVFLQPAQS